MDIAITKQKKMRLKLILLVLLMTLPVVFALQYLWFLNQAEFSVARDTLVIDEVKRGKFTVSVRGAGVLVPDNIEWLSAKVEGTVVKRAVKPGNYVKAGDLIVELSNPRLVQQLAEARWELKAMEAELKAARVTQESLLEAQKSAVLNAKLDYATSQLEYNARAELVKSSAVSQLDYQRARLARDQFKQRWLISKNQLEKMRETLVAHNEARNARLNQTSNSLAMIQQQVDDLKVLASIESVVLEMPLASGQRVMMGDNLAKLAQQDSLIAELQVPELHIREVAIGQRVIIDTRNNKIEGIVTRIDPAVINGKVQVDVEFTESLSNDARPDLSVDGEIRIAEIPDTLYVDRPLFAQSRSQSLFFKLTADGKFSERVQVSVGQGSANQIEIIDGLQAGDKIVTSDPTRFESYNKFRIN